MNSILKKMVFISLLIVTASACHPTQFIVGKGAQQNQVATQRNKFLFLGLVHTGKAPDPNVMSNHADDYTITVKLTFTDVLMNVITVGIYSPLTVMVEY